MTLVHALARAGRRVADILPGVRSLRLRARARQLDRAEGRLRKKLATSEPSLAERRAALARFYERFEEFVDVLCDGANYGPNASLEKRYAELRAWLARAYPEIRSGVLAFLQLDPADAQHSARFFGTPGDAFEALYAAPTLEEFLRSDDGHMISRIERTRDALIVYGSHLRRR